MGSKTVTPHSKANFGIPWVIYLLTNNGRPGAILKRLCRIDHFANVHLHAHYDIVSGNNSISGILTTCGTFGVMVHIISTMEYVPNFMRFLAF